MDNSIKDKINNIEKTLLEFDFPNIDFNFKRKNVRRNIEDKGYKGFALGLVNSWAGKGERAGQQQLITNRTRTPKYKDLFKEACDLMDEYDPEFKYTSIQFNKNYQCARHKDGKNMGISYIIGFGDYTDGQLIVYDELGGNPKKKNIKHKFFTFNGSEFYHETAEFTGDRITLVFYSI